MEKEKKNLLVFGYGLSVILTFISWRMYAKYGFSINIVILLTLGAGFVIASLFNVEIIKPFYKKWMKVADFIGNIITSIILAIVFYIVFGLVGIILRIFKKDLLHEKLDKKAESYWINKKKADVPDKEQLKRQF